MKKLFLLAFVIIISPQLYAQSNQLYIDSLAHLIGHDISDANLMFATTDWKFLQSTSTPNSRVTKTFEWGYSLKFVNKSPRALAWMDVGVKNGVIKFVRYQFDDGYDYKEVIVQLKKMGAAQIETSMQDGNIRTDFMDNERMYNLVSVAKGTYNKASSYYLEIQDRDFYFKK